MVGKQFAELGGVPGEQEGSDHDVGAQRISTVIGNLESPDAGKPRCRCGGDGMVTVYNDKETGAYLGNERALIDPERKVTESMYPCPACRPDQFIRWQKGCDRPDHDKAGCPVCSAVQPKKKGSR